MVAGNVLVPGTAFVELALWAGARSGLPQLAELTLEAPLALPEHESVRMQVLVGDVTAEGTRSVGVHACASGRDEWTRHAFGVLAAADYSVAGAPEKPWPPSAAEELDVDLLYSRLAETRLEYGPVFRGVRRAWRRDEDLFAEVELDAPETRGFLIHPALLDASLHVAAFNGLFGDAQGTRLPFAWNGVRPLGPAPRTVRVHVRRVGTEMIALAVSDDSGRLVLTTESFATRPVGAAQLRPSVHRDSLFAIDWQSLPVTAAGGAVPVVGTALAERLRVGGVEVTEYGESDAMVRMPNRLLVENRSAAEALAWCQRWISDESSASKQLVLVTLDARTDPEQAAIWGLVRSAQTEHPHRFVLLDLDGARASYAAVTAALDSGEPQLAIAEGTVTVPRLARPVANSGRTWNPDGTVLITGGTGALGALVARYLVAEHGVRHVLLTSRRGLEARGASELAMELTGLGARVTVAACDVADRASLTRVLAEIPADLPLTGIVHAAGILDDGVLAAQTPDRLAALWRPKVEAALLLDELTREADLTAFVLFSSYAATFGSAGQAAYAAANAGLDALARRRAAAGKPATALAWGPWAEAGMAVESLTDADWARMSRWGIGPMDSAEGLALLDTAVGSGLSTLVPVRLDIAALRSRTDDLPALLGGLVRRPVRAAAPVVGFDVAEGGIDGVLAFVREQVATALGAAGGAAVDPDRTFEELGFDSLIAVEFRNRLQHTTGIRLSPTLVFDYPTVTAMAEHLLMQLRPPAADPAASVTARLDDLEISLGALEPDNHLRAEVAGRLKALLANWQRGTGADDGPTLDIATDDG
ncbi:SDR family NAD(P)-dependent oxidoreductase, partial [Nocardia tengchongensis]|uniref:SDR family NAD(P)-dependent oxidoreductase n=1 Tax=Nocardia tengchongensis TaxID=2055889 RepID=UPI0036909A0F